MKIFALSALLALVTAPAWAQPAPSAAMGRGLFEQPGANSCMYCHGIAGHDGKVAVAAKLNEPKNWKAYKASGGDLAKIEEAVEDAVMNGAIVHNMKFKPAWYEVKKAGGPLNGQMLGLTGAPSKAWLDRFKEKGVTKEIAAKSLWLYVQTFDSQGVFKK